MKNFVNKYEQFTYMIRFLSMIAKFCIGMYDIFPLTCDYYQSKDDIKRKETSKKKCLTWSVDMTLINKMQNTENVLD